MCDICKTWKSKEMTAKQAIDEIGRRLSTAKHAEAKHLWDLSTKILDQEVPMEERDVDADHGWWAKHHPEPTEE